MKIISQEIKSKAAALELASNMNGFVEGPLMDDKMEKTYIVFYRNPECEEG